MTKPPDSSDSAGTQPEVDDATSETGADRPTAASGEAAAAAAELEDAFFGDGAPVPDDWVDPDLADDGARVVAQPMLLILVAALAIFLGVQYPSEFLYFFTDRDAVELGHADEIGTRDEFMVDGALTLPSNRYVDVDGIAMSPAVAGNHRFFKLVGAHVYVQEQVPRQARVLRGMAMPVPRGEESLQPMYDDPGRLIAFEDLPSRYRGIVDFYSNVDRTWFCGYEPSTALRTHLLGLRGREELRLQDELGRRPTAEEVDEAAHELTRCRQGYLLIARSAPEQHWTYVAIYAGLALVGVGSLWLLIGWARARFASD